MATTDLPHRRRQLMMPKIVSESRGAHVLLTEPVKQKQRRPYREYRCAIVQIPSEG